MIFRSPNDETIFLKANSQIAGQIIVLSSMAQEDLHKGILPPSRGYGEATRPSDPPGRRRRVVLRVAVSIHRPLLTIAGPMNAPLAGSWSVEVRAVRPYAIHGDLYYELHVVRTDDPAAPAPGPTTAPARCSGCASRNMPSTASPDPATVSKSRSSWAR